MATELKPSPNTHLGEVTWHRDMHFGRLLYVCQGLLGLDPQDKYDYKFINSKEHDIEELWDFFEVVELENGKLGLRLHIDDCFSVALATIETRLPYGRPVPDQVFLNLIEDFIEHVRGLPLETSGEDPYTEEEIATLSQDLAPFLELLYGGLAGVDFESEEYIAGDEIPF